MKTPNTANRPEYVKEADSDCWLLTVWVQPGARRSEFCGEYQGCLKLRVAAPPVDNKANKTVAEFVARSLGLRKNQVFLKSGHTNRKKVLAVDVGTEPDWNLIAPSA